jgi:DNA-binding NtrC family response regulator
MRQAAARAQVAVPELDAGAIRALAACDWPGNVRQLRFVIERAVALWPDQVIGADEIGMLLAGEARHPPAGSPPEMQSLAEMERALVARAMREAGGNRTRAAELLGITPRGLYNKLRRNGTSFRSSE